MVFRCITETDIARYERYERERAARLDAIVEEAAAATAKKMADVFKASPLRFKVRYRAALREAGHE